MHVHIKQNVKLARSRRYTLRKNAFAGGMASNMSLATKLIPAQAGAVATTLRMEVVRVQIGYPRFFGSGGFGFGVWFLPTVFGFGYPKLIGFGAGFQFRPRITIGGPK
jgi:hypothetical protein